ncbi:MAG: hypothetical protein GY853_14220 [PVC group bacterium]|nr:hypothetical protein [PVC group bacterium]
MDIESFVDHSTKSNWRVMNGEIDEKFKIPEGGKLDTITKLEAMLTLIDVMDSINESEELTRLDIIVRFAEYLKGSSVQSTVDTKRNRRCGLADVYNAKMGD